MRERGLVDSIDAAVSELISSRLGKLAHAVSLAELASNRLLVAAIHDPAKETIPNMVKGHFKGTSENSSNVAVR
jgi:hypothetical protein